MSKNVSQCDSKCAFLLSKQVTQLKCPPNGTLACCEPVKSNTFCSSFLKENADQMAPFCFLLRNFHCRHFVVLPTHAFKHHFGDSFPLCFSLGVQRHANRQRMVRRKKRTSFLFFAKSVLAAHFDYGGFPSLTKNALKR